MGSRLRRTVNGGVTGLVAAAAMSSFMIVAERSGVLPPAHRDRGGRAGVMLPAHPIYGAVLGRLLEHR